MRLEAVTVCVGYADFLAETLPLNKPHFDRLLVVTTPDDVATQLICRHHHVEFLTTDVFTTDGGAFRKGAGINEGLKRLSANYGTWWIHLDADVVLPAQTRSILETASLSPYSVYGIDRCNVLGYAAWRQHCASPKLQQQTDRCLVHLADYPLGARLNVPHLGGWAPIGFFQMWNPLSSGIKTYPTDHDGADRTDMLFACQWPRRFRGFIPEIVAWHLESEPTPMGANWGGRTTAPFAPAPRRRDWRALLIGLFVLAALAGLFFVSLSATGLVALVWLCLCPLQMHHHRRWHKKRHNPYVE